MELGGTGGALAPPLPAAPRRPDPAARLHLDAARGAEADAFRQPRTKRWPSPPRLRARVCWRACVCVCHRRRQREAGWVHPPAHLQHGLRFCVPGVKNEENPPHPFKLPDHPHFPPTLSTKFYFVTRCSTVAPLRKLVPSCGPSLRPRLRPDFRLPASVRRGDSGFPPPAPPQPPRRVLPCTARAPRPPPGKSRALARRAGPAAEPRGRALGPRGSPGRPPRYLKPSPMPLPAPLCAPAGAAQEERSARLHRSASRRGNTCSRQPGRHASPGRGSPRSPLAARSEPMDACRAPGEFWILALDA